MQDEQSEEHGLTLGAMDYIRKPYNIQSVKAKIKNHLEIKQHKDRLKENSLVDELTQIANRRKFNDVLEIEIRRAKRTGSKLSVLMLDIDHFKDYNDTYGHLEGDDCLKKVAKVLKDSINRPGDLVARWGGEEFVILLLDTDREGTAFIAEKLRRSVEELGIRHEASLASDVVTVSIGGAVSNPSDITSYEKLVMMSDKALYVAKRTGRNRISID
jgi:diguanylate cyclase (GGDEF)-like protein